MTISPERPSWAVECSPGPDYPSGDVPLYDLLPIIAAREAAAAECRARVRALLQAWPT